MSDTLVFLSMSLNKPLNSLAPDDIVNLVDDRISEGRILEFKRELSLGTDNEKGEFLADLTAFANGGGWDIVFGVRDEGGVAVEITAFPVSDMDELKLKIGSIIEAGIEPRMSYEIREFQFDDRFVLIIRVPRSWLPPHRVVFTQSSKHKGQFYLRNTAGKSHMDTLDLRKAFLYSEQALDKAKEFRNRRLLEIDATISSLQYWLIKRHAISLHLIPLNAFSDDIGMKVLDIASDLRLNPIPPLFVWNYCSSAINFHWFKNSACTNSGFESHAQYYRSWIIEMVCFDLPDPSDLFIRGKEIEEEIIGAYDAMARYCERMGVPYPVLIWLTLIWYEGQGIIWSRGNILDGRIEQHVLKIPELLIDSTGLSWSDILRPAFDLMWNSCGYPASPYYDSLGCRRD